MDKDNDSVFDKLEDVQRRTATLQLKMKELAFGQEKIMELLLNLDENKGLSTIKDFKKLREERSSRNN